MITLFILWLFCACKVSGDEDRRIEQQHTTLTLEPLASKYCDQKLTFDEAGINFEI